MKQMKSALGDAGVPRPRFASVMLERGKHSLEHLLESGIRMAILGNDEGTTLIRFSKLGKAFRARKAAGWDAIKVKSALGPISTLLLEGENVSGILRVRR